MVTNYVSYSSYSEVALGTQNKPFLNSVIMHVLPICPSWYLLQPFKTTLRHTFTQYSYNRGQFGTSGVFGLWEETGVPRGNPHGSGRTYTLSSSWLRGSN